MGPVHIVVELRQVMAGVTVTGSIAISPEAFARVPEVSSGPAQDESTPDAAHQALNLRLRSALLEWLTQGHQAAVQSLHVFACDLLQAQFIKEREEVSRILGGTA